MAEQYKIELGVKLRDGAIQNEINEAQKTLKPIELKVDAETKELTNTIREALNSLSKGTKNALTIDTSKIEASLDKLSSVVADIKSSLGTLDGKGMKDLVSSINQMANALGKAENESESLVKSLTALSKKDLSINFGFNMGKSASQVASEQGDVKRNAISQLKQQAKALEDYLDSYYKVTQQGTGVAKLTQGTNLFRDYWELSPNIGDTKISLKQQVATYKQYIDLMRQAAKIKGVDLSGVTLGFSKSTDDIVKDTNNAANGVEQLTQAFKGLFGSGVDGEKLSTQLNDIVVDLGEIKNSLQGLSQNNAIDSLTQSFNKLSETLDRLMTNAKLVQDVLGNVGTGAGSGANIGVGDNLERQTQQAQQSAKEIQQAAKQTADAYDKISKDTSLVRDGANFQDTFEKTNQAAQEAQRHFQELLADEKAVVSVTEQFDNNNALQSFVVNIKRASGEVENLRYAIDKLDDEEKFTYQGGSANDSSVEKQLERSIKKANDLQIKLDKLKSNYSDVNAARPIKDSEHIEALDEQYRKVERAIADVRNADNSTFSSMISNAEKEKAALENMVREFRNVENVATSLRSKDIDTVKSTYGSKLDVLISKMQSSGVYTSGFEGGAENLRSILSGATDASGLVKFLNGLDKLEAGYKRANAAVKEFNRSQKVGINVSGLESKIADIQRISPEIDKFETEINGAKVTVKSLLGDLGKVKTQGDFSVVNAKFKAFADAAKAAGIAITETAQKTKSIDDIKIKLELGTFENQVHQLHDSLDQLTDVDGSLDKLRISINQVDNAYDAMITAAKANDDEALVQAQKKLAVAVEKTNNELKIQAREQRAVNNAAKLADSKAALKTDMLNWLKNNSKATKEYKAEIDRLIASLDKLDQAGVNGARRKFNQIDKDAELKGVKGLNFLDSIKNKIKEYSVYFGAAELFMYAEQGLRSMFEQVKLIDSAMTELKKVTNETDAAYDKFLTNAASRAREIGTTIDGLVSSTADFARLGYGFEDAQGLAEVANIYAVVGDEIEGVEGATESLISTMAAFKQTQANMSNSEFAMDIVDKFNEVSNNFAISSGGLGEALKRSASALFSANNSLDESIAMITASNTVVQNPETVGQAYKTIALRIRGAKSELEEMGEDTEGVIESSSKLREEILALSGVDIMEADGQTFKSTYDILNEISKVYKDLSDVSQANILEIFAGKRQSNILSAALENFDIARDALETSLNSSGSALEEHEKWQKSLEADLCLGVWKQAL